MRHILIPFDFTETAENALVYAISLFENSLTTFYLLYANQYKPSQLLGENYHANWKNQTEQKSEKELQKYTSKLNDSTTDYHRFEGIFHKNTIVKAIEAVLKETPIDLIVSGTRGAKVKSDIFLTTRTLNIVNNIDQCPILVVPYNYEYEPIDKLTFSTNYHKFFTLEELKPMLEIRESFDAHIEVVNLSEEEYLSPIQKENKQQVERILFSHDFSFKKIDFSESEANTLKSHMKISKSQLLCLVKHKHHWINRLFEENVVKKASFHSEVPLLIIPS